VTRNRRPSFSGAKAGVGCFDGLSGACFGDFDRKKAGASGNDLRCGMTIPVMSGMTVSVMSGGIVSIPRPEARGE
jgi:hypothetical protein